MKRTKKWQIRRALPLAGVLFLAVLALGGCKKKAENGTQTNAALKTVRIGFPTSGDDWPSGVLGFASEFGYLDEYLAPLGYKASLHGFVGAAPAIHEALVAKELDYVVYAGMAAVLSKSNGIEHTLLSATSWGSGWKLISRSGAGIERLSDLKGKKIAYMRGASPHMYLIRVLTEGGLTFGDIEAVNTTIPEGIAGVVSGVIDAAVISAGQEASLVADGTARVSHSGFDADKSVYYEPFVLIGRTEFYTANRETAVAIQKGLLKAKDWARAHPDEYFRLHSERSGNPLEVVLATAEYDFDVSTPLNLDNQYVDSLKKIEVFLRTNNLISGSVDFDQWVDDYAAVQALKEYTGEK